MAGMKLTEFYPERQGRPDSKQAMDMDNRKSTMTIPGKAYSDLKLLRSFMNGSFQEKFDATVVSAGGVITMSIEKTGSGDLTMQFSDGLTTFDTTPAATIILTAGSDTSPQVNWIYIPQSTKTLTKSTVSWPAGEHIRVAFFFCQTAASMETAGGPIINQNWNDFLEDENSMGHLLHISEKIRLLDATYFSGVNGAGTSGYLTITAGNVELKISSGVIYQLHSQTFPAFDTSTGSTVHVKNWSGDAYKAITNLHDITADSGGNAIGNNKYFNLVMWGVQNKSGEHQTVMINLPSGFYNTQADAENDVSGYDDFTMPREFNIDSSVGFLIVRITIRMGGTWTHVSEVDLRGTNPQTASGAAAGIVSAFADNVFKVYDEADITKILALDVGALISSGNTRTLQPPDYDGVIATLAGTEVFTNKTLTSPTINGTIATTGLTLPAHTSGVITLTSNVPLKRNVDNSYLSINGGSGTAGQGSRIILIGADQASAGAIEISTPNAAKNADVKRLFISGSLTTAVATWTAVTHAGIVTSDIDINGGTLDGVTITAPAINGTVTTTGLTLPAITLSGTVSGANQDFDVGSGTMKIETTGGWQGFQITSTRDDALGPKIYLRLDSASPEPNDDLGVLGFRGNDSTSVMTEYGAIYIQSAVVTNNSETGKFLITLKNNGSDNLAMTLSGAGDGWFDRNLEIGGTLTGVTTLTASTINAFTLGGTMTLNGQTFDAGAGTMLMTSTASQPLILQSTTANTTGLSAAMTIRAISTGNMADGFGAGIIFQIGDDTDPVHQIGLIDVVRDQGDDDAGKMTFYVDDAAGTNRILLRMYAVTGYTTILTRAGSYFRFGDAGTTSHGITTDDDVLVTGKLEVDGKLWADGGADLAALCEADAYTVGGAAGIDFSGAVTNITVVKGIVTAAS